MTEAVAEPKILRRPSRVRFLKVIAVFKILQGLLLLAVGISLLSLGSRTTWLDAISDWTDDRLMIVQNGWLLLLLTWLQDVLAGGHLRAAGLLALIYSGLLCVVGIGVYLQKRWAEILLIIAIGGLIPFEAHHLWFKPSAGALIVLTVNCFIVWFLYRVLRRTPPHTPAPREPELAEQR